MKEYESVLLEIENDRNVRENLSRLRQMIKAEAQDFFVFQEEGNGDVLPRICREKLSAQDPKIRKNAALLLGDLAKERAGWAKEKESGTLNEAGPISEKTMPEEMASDSSDVNALWEGYEREGTLFVKSAYLKALNQYRREALAPLGGKILSRAEAFENMEFAPQEQKHARQEKQELNMLREKFLRRPQKKKVCRCPDGRHRLLLLCEPGIREKLASKAEPLSVKVKTVSSGVMAVTDRAEQVLNLRLYREVWFIVRQSASLKADREHLALAAARSELLPILKKFYPQEERYSFRLRLIGADDIKRRSDFLQKIAFALEELTGGKLWNQTESADAEIILKEKKDRTFGIFVKIVGLPNHRFSYRKKIQPTSMHPAAAAAMLALAEPYLREGAQVLDPFCGVGTLLIERARLKRAGHMYGTDIFGDAVRDARENVHLASAGCDLGKSGSGKDQFPEIYLINRDYFDFTSEYLFDEIITEFPRFYGKTAEEKNRFFGDFFARSTELLSEEGVLIFLTEEENQVKKQIRLSKELRLERQIQLRGQECVYVVKKR